MSCLSCRRKGLNEIYVFSFYLIHVYSNTVRVSLRLEHIVSMSREKTLQESVALFERLKKDFSNSKCDLVQCGNLLSQLKVGG